MASSTIAQYSDSCALTGRVPVDDLGSFKESANKAKAEFEELNRQSEQWRPPQRLLPIMMQQAIHAQLRGHRFRLVREAARMKVLGERVGPTAGIWSAFPVGNPSGCADRDRRYRLSRRRRPTLRVDRGKPI